MDIDCKMAPSTFMELPAELLQHMFSFLNQTDRAIASLACRFWHQNVCGFNKAQLRHHFFYLEGIATELKLESDLIFNNVEGRRDRIYPIGRKRIAIYRFEPKLIDVINFFTCKLLRTFHLGSYTYLIKDSQLYVVIKKGIQIWNLHDGSYLRTIRCDFEGCVKEIHVDDEENMYALAVREKKIEEFNILYGLDHRPNALWIEKWKKRSIFNINSYLSSDKEAVFIYRYNFQNVHIRCLKQNVSKPEYLNFDLASFSPSFFHRCVNDIEIRPSLESLDLEEFGLKFSTYTEGYHLYYKGQPICEDNGERRINHVEIDQEKIYLLRVGSTRGLILDVWSYKDLENQKPIKQYEIIPLDMKSTLKSSECLAYFLDIERPLKMHIFLKNHLFMVDGSSKIKLLNLTCDESHVPSIVCSKKISWLALPTKISSYWYSHFDGQCLILAAGYPGGKMYVFDFNEPKDLITYPKEKKLEKSRNYLEIYMTINSLPTSAKA